eukprot:5932200-Amphidinium_carterae.1
MDNGAQPQKSEGQRQPSSTVLTSTERFAQLTQQWLASVQQCTEDNLQRVYAIYNCAHCYMDNVTMHWLKCHNGKGC